MENAAANRYFEVILNGNFFSPAYTLVLTSEKKALSAAVKEAKANNNTSVQLIEVDAQGGNMEGYVSPTISL